MTLKNRLFFMQIVLAVTMLSISLNAMSAEDSNTIQTKITITRKMTVTADIAWNAVSGIGRLDIWYPAIASSRVEGDGIGALRHMTTEAGGILIDRIVDINEQEKRLIYQRIEAPFEMTSYIGTVEVFESFDALAVVVWTVDLETGVESSAALSEALKNGIGDGLEGMEKDLAGSNN